MSEKVLELKNICKSFGPTKALSGVSFDLEKGEIHCLVGENGAGKSTLIKVLAGIHKPDSGTICMDGKTEEIHSPKDSERLGISVVHQELMLCTDLTVAENIFLGRESMRGLFLDKAAQKKKTEELLASIDPSVKPGMVVNTLNTGKKQIVEIARAISGGTRVVVFDEPTSSLSEKEVENLMAIIERLRDQGIAIIYISHKMEEVFRLADRVTVLRDGSSVGTLKREELEKERMVALMVGRNLDNYYVRNHKPSDRILFEAKEVSGGMIRNSSFYVREGEILGFSGLVGAGRTELMRLVFGIDKKRTGTFFMNGQEIRLNHPSDAIKAGIAYIPEDRKLEGLFLEKGIDFNMSICSLTDLIRNLKVNRRGERALIDRYGKAMKLKMASYDQEIQALSGGNQQKVLVGRWLAVAKKVIILDEPTRGIDVGAKSDIYEMLDELSGQGYGIVIVSSELQEILGMCDRVYVMKDYKICGCLEKEEIDSVSIMNYAIGVN
ncbi:MAG: sugar ABC transporter ATP-binding protein [Eubacteriales bacterium]|nr:sugar ABC transporter ATP-binding protein [Eubacteriales bacterium]